jgi:hypothetical protein
MADETGTTSTSRALSGVLAGLAGTDDRGLAGLEQRGWSVGVAREGGRWGARADRGDTSLLVFDKSRSRAIALLLEQAQD